MARFTLAFGIHNHQPVGNFNAVFEDAHRHAYAPFLELLAKSQGISISLHQSGILWDWQKKNHPEFFERVGALLDDNKLELMTGGFYEPILTSIPERDALGQIQQLDQFLKEHFEVDTSGLWLTERIWEPHLPRPLNQAGVKYIPIDDTHFIYAGYQVNQLGGVYVTEHEGYPLRLLPIQKKLRYLIPFGKVTEVIEELKRQADRNPEGMAVYADDGEKFGVWPHTYQHCYEDGWLERFFEALEKNSDWLEVAPLGQAAQADPIGRAYLPTASYEEMLHWSLPTDAFREYEEFERWLKDSGQQKRFGRFVRGAHWRNFLTKYDESNLMHKKMQWLSDRLAQAEEEHPEHKVSLQTARQHLYAAQCNCPYWHGVFGGLYLPHIRQAVHTHLVKGLSTLHSLSNQPTQQAFDFDRDGFDEVVFESEPLTAIVRPHRGGTLLDLSVNKSGFELTDTLSRRREGYHARLDQAVLSGDSDESASIHDLVLAKEEGLSGYLIEDWYLKRCFVDHFLAPEVEAEHFRKGHLGEEGDFVLEPYESQYNADQFTTELTRIGHVWRNDRVYDVTVRKQFQFDPSSGVFAVAYQLSCADPEGLTVNFAVENNFNFQAGHAEDRYVQVDGKRDDQAYLDSVGEYAGCRHIGLYDEFLNLAVAVESDRSADLWHQPIFTVSLSEGGFERVYQGTTTVHRFRLTLTPEPTEIRFTVQTGLPESVKQAALQATERSV